MKLPDMSRVVITAFDLPAPEMEYKFHPKRKWRMDFAYPKQKLCVEIEGGVYGYGRHNRATGFVKDMEKYNAAAELGWRILRYQPGGIDYAQIKTALGGV